MKICAIPLDISYENPEENIVSAAHALSMVEPDTDIVVLPELFTTAFVPDSKMVEALAEPNDGKTMQAVRRWAAFFGFAIAGSFLAVDPDGRRFNRAFFVEPGGDTTFYDKRHLFPLSTEDNVLTPGQKMPPRIRFRGWDITLVVCFDIRFPVWCRNTPQLPADVMLVPSNWPHSRIEQYKILLKARAVENQMITVGANRIGHDPFGEYEQMDTDMFDYLGNSIKETRRNGLVYTLLERHDLEEARRRFPFLSVSDKWEIELENH
ncbi:MAG: nitrilase family protein [Muribaculaceae bacterium]|nr:nitrilase family protein [Muribaculaceae bacterium]